MQIENCHQHFLKREMFFYLEKYPGKSRLHRSYFLKQLKFTLLFLGNSIKRKKYFIISFSCQSKEVETRINLTNKLNYVSPNSFDYLKLNYTRKQKLKTLVSHSSSSRQKPVLPSAYLPYSRHYHTLFLCCQPTLFSKSCQNSSPIYDQYSREVYNQERVMMGQI